MVALRSSTAGMRCFNASAPMLNGLDILSPLTAISPIDGRYGDKTLPLRAVFSEYGLIAKRVAVEIEWFKMLSENDQIPEVPRISANGLQVRPSTTPALSTAVSRTSGAVCENPMYLWRTTANELSIVG